MYKAQPYNMLSYYVFMSETFQETTCFVVIA